MRFGPEHMCVTVMEDSMDTFFKAIDEHVLEGIHEYEEQQLLKFKSEFNSLCLSISKQQGWDYTICVTRWTDTANRWSNRPLDGYTATLQVEFMKNGEVVELDESGCSFFENITFIDFHPIRRKYRVFQNEELADIRTEIKQFIRGFEEFK